MKNSFWLKAHADGSVVSSQLKKPGKQEKWELTTIKDGLLNKLFSFKSFDGKYLTCHPDGKVDAKFIHKPNL